MEKLQVVYPSGNNLSVSTFYMLCSLFDNIREREYIKSDDRIIKAKEHIDLYFKEVDCLEKACSLSKLSRRRFNDLFKKLFGVTPNRYAVLKRIELAENLLSLGSLSVTEISSMCGFSDIYYFSKLFKSIVGISPKAYKKRTEK